MTQVLSASLQSKTNSFYSSSPVASSGLRRSSSQPNYLGTVSGRTYAPPAAKSSSSNTSAKRGRRSIPQKPLQLDSSTEDSDSSEESESESEVSSSSDEEDTEDEAAPSTTSELSDTESRFSVSSVVSTPATNNSLDTPTLSPTLKRNAEATNLFPTYEEVGYFGRMADQDEPSSLRSGRPVQKDGNSTPSAVSSLLSGPATPELDRIAEDDTAVRHEPTRHVDYLSHEWREEDVWTSWRYMVSMRKAYQNSSRLENASWRSWMKTKNNLKTVNAERLNWLKDCDVTWLYGPLQPGPYQTESPTDIYRQRATLDKKPILKKRSMSEVMLQRSISTSSLLKQAAAMIQSQKQAEASRYPNVPRPGVGRANTDFSGYAFFAASSTEQRSSTITSSTSSELESPVSYQKKHIHFNDKVDQCIAINVEGGDDEDYYSRYPYDSEEDGLILKSTRRRRKPRSRQQSASSETKTIAPLPSTSLKYRKDTPEPQSASGSKRLSPSPSLETLRPAKHSLGSGTFLPEHDDYDEDETPSWNPSPPVSTPNYDSSDRLSRYGIDAGEGSAMRRTASGMFMPYETDDDEAVNSGLFGKVVDTVNTAKDIAHVIWNVGWRK